MRRLDLVGPARSSTEQSRRVQRAISIAADTIAILIWEATSHPAIVLEQASPMKQTGQTGAGQHVMSGC